MYRRNNNGGGFNRGPPTRTPVNVGEELDVAIEAVGEKGDGVAKKQGYVIFVPGTKAGESCRIRVTRTLKNVAFAEKIGEASGPVEQSQRPARQEYGQQESAPQEEEQQEEPQADSENFGEEESEEDSDDEESDDDDEEESEEEGK